MTKKLLVLFLFFTNTLLGQITLLEAPADYQLFPRNLENKAQVKFRLTSPVNGTVKYQVRENGKILEENTKTFQAKDTLTFVTTIEAKPAEYSFTISIGQQTIERDHIVCGDFLLLYGQSNIKALSGIDDFKVDTRFLRNYDTKHPSEPNVWSTAELPYASVGIVGLQLQALVLEKYGIPTCVINGSRGGASVFSLLDHGEYYKTVLSRVEGAGAKGHIKAIIWRQGEAETCNWYKDIEDYPMHFAQLMGQLDRDFPEVKKFYNIQTGILHCNQMEDAGKLREYMRQTRYLFPKVETTNMHQLPLSDDVHYSKEAYIQTAHELLPLLGRDFYQDEDFPEIRPPDIQSVQSSSAGDTLILTFEEGQNLHFPPSHVKDGFLWKMEDYFYVNTTTQAQHNLVHSGWANNNKVYLKLNWPVKEGYVSYLPSYAKHSPPSQDIHLTNSKGLRAMSFYQFPIRQLLPTPIIKSLALTSPTHVRIHFGETGNYTLERKKENETAFTLIATVSNADHYVDTADFTQKVSYRIQRKDANSVSAYSQTLAYDYSAKIAAITPSTILQNHKNPISLTGENFGADPGEVTFQGQSLPIVSWNSNEIIFRLPNNISFGEHTITVITTHKQTLSSKLLIDPLLHLPEERGPILYPQPLIDRRYVNVLSNQKILRVAAINGVGNTIQLTIKEKLPNEYLIDTGILPAGIYTLQLAGTQGTETVRFQKL